jgi:hypothetical protein
MRPVKLALAAGLALLAVAILVTLSRSPASVAQTNETPGHPAGVIASTTEGASYCQGREALPPGTSALRVWLDAAFGPRVRVTVSARGQQLTSGEQGSGWTGGSVAIPVRPLSQAISGATVCVSFPLHDETLVIQGSPAAPANAARDGSQPLPGRIAIEYLRPGGRSWASMAGAIARRMGFGRAAAGTWIAFLALALLAAIAAITTAAVLRDIS